MRILIVEDEVRIANDLADAVNSGGYVAEIASTERTRGSGAARKTIPPSFSTSACPRSMA